MAIYMRELGQRQNQKVNVMNLHAKCEREFNFLS